MCEKPRLKRPIFRLCLCAAAVSVLAACNGGLGAPMPARTEMLPRSGSGSTPISHIVLMVQENRTFNNLFAQFPGATGTIVGKGKKGKTKHAKTISIPLTEVNLEDKLNLNHLYTAYRTAFNGGKMNGFNEIIFQSDGKIEGSQPYEYVNPSQIAPYWTMAGTYALANAMFQTQGSGSFTAHQDLIAGGTGLSSSEALIDTPSYFPWGCDGNPQHLVTAVIKRGGKVYEFGGPFPCLTYSTMRDLLDAKSVSWKFYAVRVYPYTKCPKCQGAGIWSAFDAIKAVRYSSEWKDNVTRNNRQIFTDISNKNLPAVSWITPNGVDSDHPATKSDTGPSWVASIVNAVGQSSYWDSTAVVILWDDWGGFYDHVAPPEPRDWQGGPGFRIPMLIVSPYVKPHVDHTQYEFGSVLRFIEDNWSLGSLGKNDAHSTSIGNAFDFKMKPRAFKVIPSKYPSMFFLREPPSDFPLDTE